MRLLGQVAGQSPQDLTAAQVRTAARYCLEEMAERHPDCETHTAPGQGHAPLLGSKDMIRRIAKLVARAERRAG